MYTPETSCMKGTSVHIKNTGVKQLWNHKVREFNLLWLSGCENVSGPSRNGSQGRVFGNWVNANPGLKVNN